MSSQAVRSLRPTARRLTASMSAATTSIRSASTTTMRAPVKPATTASTSTSTTAANPAPRTYARAIKPASTSTSTYTARKVTPAATPAAKPAAAVAAAAAPPPPVVDPETPTAPASSPTDSLPPLPDAPPATYNPDAPPVDWSSSFHGLSSTAFSAETARILMAPIEPDDIEMKPDGIIYLPEIKYRRILNLAFGPGGWGLAPRGELAVGDKVVSREYALVVAGRFVGQARGECGYFGGDDGVTTAGEGCKSNALMRCCKDLGIASELWDPRFIRKFKAQYCKEVWVEHVVTKKRRQIWVRNDCPPAYPYTLVKK